MEARNFYDRAVAAQAFSDAVAAAPQLEPYLRKMYEDNERLYSEAEDREETVESLKADIETLCNVTQAHSAEIARWLAEPLPPATCDLVRMATEMDSLIQTVHGA